VRERARRGFKQRGSWAGGCRRRLRLGLAVLVLAPLGVVATASVAGAVTPTVVSIGNGTQLSDGSYLNAQNLANALALTSVIVQATTSITVVGPLDMSSGGVYGTPRYNFTLSAPVCNIDGDLNLSIYGPLFLTCGTVNLDGEITAGGTTISPSRVTSTATQVNVQSNSASIQQGIDDSSDTSPVTVQVSPGNYAGNLTINHPVTLAGSDGTAASGADPTAPTITGTQPGGNVLTVTANNVDVDGLQLDGTVSDGSSTPSVDGVLANNVDSITIAHNTFTNFTGPGIDTTGSTNVVRDANLIDGQPDGALPETPLAPMLPVLAAVLIAGAVLLRRRRTQPSR
jgi:hypothetical protein